ncbi:hypothetical protein KCP78_05095 [Salmonella enterica subsp. enterica]|nr:hypothetical protein KCP78_05095 [Salmonella enterica subsp. enterica]
MEDLGEFDILHLPPWLSRRRNVLWQAFAIRRNQPFSEPRNGQHHASWLFNAFQQWQWRF